MDLLGSFVALVAVLVCVAIWLLPIIPTGSSDRTSGKEKVVWPRSNFDFLVRAGVRSVVGAIEMTRLVGDFSLTRYPRIR